MTTPSVIQAKVFFARACIFAIADALKAMQHLAISSLVLLSRNSCGGYGETPENKLSLNESRQVFPRIHFTETVRFRAIAEAGRSATSILLLEE
ncbi:MAG: hypothetical protein ACXW04_12285 [Methylobacter sp.]